MTLQQWLSKHNFAVRIVPRGFNIENGDGDARFVQLLFAQQITKFVTYADIYKWIKNNISSDLFDDNAREDFKNVVA